MRIFHVIATLGPGGAEKLVHDLLCEFACSGMQVRLLLLAGARGSRGELLLKELTYHGVEVIGAEERKVASFSNLLKIVKNIYKWRPDVVHTHLFNGEVAVVFARIFIFGFRPLYARTLHSKNITGSKPAPVIRLLGKFFDWTVACSPTVFDNYNSFMSGKNKSKVDTIFNGCRLPKRTTAGDRNLARAVLDIDDNSFVVVQVGNFMGNSLSTAAKGQDTLLRSFAASRLVKGNSMLIFVGDGILRAHAEKLAWELRIHEKVKFLGVVADPLRVIQAADVYCMPSRHEGLPLALLEAAATGIPIIATDLEEIRSLIPDNDWFLFPVDDIIALAEALDIMKEKGILSLDRSQFLIENYSAQVCAEKYLNGYHQRIIKK